MAHLLTTSCWIPPKKNDYFVLGFFCLLFPGTYTDPGGFSGKETAIALAPRDSRCSKDGCCSSRNCGAVFFFPVLRWLCTGSLCTSAFFRWQGKNPRARCLTRVLIPCPFTSLLNMKGQTRPKQILLYMHGYGSSYSASTHSFNVDSGSLDPRARSITAFVTLWRIFIGGQHLFQFMSARLLKITWPGATHT